MMRRAAALLAALLGLAIAPAAQAQTAGTTVRPAGALVEPERYDSPARGEGAERPRGAGDRGGGAADPRGGRRAPEGLRARLPRRAGPLAAVVVPAAGARRAPPRGDRPGAGARPRPAGARGVDRPAGRVADGARLPGPVRALGQRAVGVDRAVRPVRAAVRAPAAAPAAPRPGGAAGVLGLLRVLRGGGARRLRAERLPAARLPAGADGDRRPAAARAASAAADRARLPAAGGRLPARVPDRAQRRRRQRDRRRLRERDRRRPARRRRAALRRVPARQRARRHLRARRLRGLRAVRAAAAVDERHVGRPARRPRGGGRVRPRLRGACSGCSAGGCATARSACCSRTSGSPSRSR